MFVILLFFLVIPILLFIVLPIVLIVKLTSSKNNKSVATDPKIAKLNQDILIELDKENPDYEKIKLLKAEMAKRKTMTYSPLAASNVDPLPFEKPEMDGLSVALYVGSLLILAGVGGLVSSGAKTYGLILLIVMALVFYIGGILIRNNTKLKLASHVFVGTGMIILPFIGMLIYAITNSNPELIWFILSLFGVPAYIFATYIMQSKVFAYFSILGLVSLSCSMVSTIGLPMFWYFIAVMILGIIFDILGLIGVTKKNTVFTDSVRQSGDWLPLIAFITSFTAMYFLSEQEYLIMLSVILVQLGLKLWGRPAIWRENLFRLTLFGWVIVLIHFIDPTLKSVGLALAIVALLQVIYSFYKITRDAISAPWRIKSETAWLIVSTICLMIAGPMIGSSSSTEIWGWTLTATMANCLIFYLARLIFARDEWYIGLIIGAIILPTALLNLIKVDTLLASALYMVFYIIEMFGLEALFWPLKGKTADILTISAIIFLSLAAIIVKSNQINAAPVYLAAATGFGLRGIFKKQLFMKEISIYLLIASIISLTTEIGPNLPSGVLPIIIAHLVMCGLLTTSLLWEKNDSRTRLLLGNVILLLVNGIVAIIEVKASWAMYLFTFEAVATLAYGLALKLKPIWMTGTGAIFLAVLWFTKDLPFVLPVILGISIIVAVVIALLKRNTPNSN